ncbi:dihydrodipicolinate synthase family protein, partial [Candidatus Atribacteria bacterium HGW-Atribacteria-1]
MEKKLKGLVPPMLTVFKKDESFDEQGTRRFVNFLIEKGAQGLIPCGSSGEFITMTLEERKRVAEVVV